MPTPDELSAAMHWLGGLDLVWSLDPCWTQEEGGYCQLDIEAPDHEESGNWLEFTGGTPAEVVVAAWKELA